MPRIIRIPIAFRTAMTDGNELGHRVSRWALGHYFQPVNDRRSQRLSS